MRNPKEINKINHFLSLVLPIVVDVVRTILQSFDWQVTEEGSGLDLAFSIKSGEKEIKFFLHNLLLEIVTVDRDEVPLRFDENLWDFDFFLAKTTRLIRSKLEILEHLASEKDFEQAVENIAENASKYERIRIWRVDQKKLAQGHGP